MKPNRVYSTETGRICPNCDRPKTQCTCKQKNNEKINARSGQDGIVRIRRETKGRKGAGVTLIDGLTMDNAALKILAKTLKQKCSSGGAIKEGIIEIQGDHRDKVKALLDKEGFITKLAGG